MVIIGAKGFAKEVLEIFHIRNETKDLVFYDDLTVDLPDKIFNKFPVLRNEDELKLYFLNFDNRFVLGLGNPKYRVKLANRIEYLGGLLTSVISPSAEIGSFDNIVNRGTQIMSKTVITNSVTIGKGVLINLACTIGHDVKIGDFSEISPNTSISGNVKIGNEVFIGTSSVILPNIKIGEKATIGAGTVVTKDVPPNATVVGVPGKVINCFNE